MNSGVQRVSTRTGKLHLSLASWGIVSQFLVLCFSIFAATSLVVASHRLDLKSEPQSQPHKPCIPRDFGRGSVVCVCNSTYCDSAEILHIPPPPPPHTYENDAPTTPQLDSFNRNLIQIYTSSKSGQRLHKSVQFFNDNRNKDNYSPGLYSPSPYSSLYTSLSNSLLPPPPELQASSSTSRNDSESFLSSVEKATTVIYDNGLDFSPSQESFSYSSSSQLASSGLGRLSSSKEHRFRRHRQNNPRLPRQIDVTNLPRSIASRILGLLGIGERSRFSPRQEEQVQEPSTEFIVAAQQIYQEVIGIGGSFTDAAGFNIGLLSKPTQERLMRSYFGKDGNDYSLGRVPIGGTDFSMRAYTLNDVSFLDMNLTQFSLQPEDHNLKIPLIKWAQSLSSHKIRLLASPWSAPVWMKTNTKLNGFGFLKRQMYQVWADYFVKFIDAYRAQNVSIWGVTTGNEPMNGFIPEFPFNCMGWSPSMVKNWIMNNLGPSLKNMNARHRRERQKRGKNSEEEDDVKLIILDDNKINLALWGPAILGDKASAQYVHGVGTHWYFDFLTPQDVLGQFHQRYPNYFLIQTEACLGFTPWELDGKVIPGSWERAERYLQAIINDMNNWVGGWIDWNLALNPEGGPNWANWAADSAILVNAQKDEFFKQPFFYAIGHVSKFVPPGSRRIGMTGTHVSRNLQSVAFLRPDNGTVLVFLNKNSHDITMRVYDERRGSTHLTIPARSMQTLVYF